jgi:hypothetical protein
VKSAHRSLRKFLRPIVKRSSEDDESGEDEDESDKDEEEDDEAMALVEEEVVDDAHSADSDSEKPPNASEDSDSSANEEVTAHRKQISPVSLKKPSKARTTLSNIAPVYNPSSRQTQPEEDAEGIDNIMLLPSLDIGPPLRSPPITKAGKPERTAAEKNAANRTKTGARGTTEQQMATASQNVQLLDDTRLFLERSLLGYVRLDVVYNESQFHGDYINDRRLVKGWVIRLFEDFSYGSGIRSSMFPLSIAVHRHELSEGFKFGKSVGDNPGTLSLRDYPDLNIYVANGNHRREAAKMTYADSEEAKKILDAKIKLGEDDWNEEEEGVTFAQAKTVYKLIKKKSKQARYMFAEVHDKGQSAWRTTRGRRS